MDRVTASLFVCCEQVLRGDTRLLAGLRAQGFECQEGRWDFSLPRLYQWLSRDCGLAGMR
jgi:hypothetical protein